MGDLQSEEKRDVVLELKLPAVSSLVQDHVLKASLSYFNVITYAANTVTFNLNIERKGMVYFIIILVRTCILLAIDS